MSMQRTENSGVRTAQDIPLVSEPSARKHIPVPASGMILLRQLALGSRGSDKSLLPSLEAVVTELREHLPHLDDSAAKADRSQGMLRSHFWYGLPCIPLALAIGRVARADHTAPPSMLLTQALERLGKVEVPFACQPLVPVDVSRQAEAVTARVDEVIALSPTMAQAIDLSRNRMASSSRLIVSRRSWIQIAIVEKIQREASDGRRKDFSDLHRQDETKEMCDAASAGVQGKNAGGQLAKLSLDDMQKIAAERGGECLSDSYVTVHEARRWRCADGHEWEAPFSQIKYSNNWCPTCARRSKLSLDDMRKVAAERGGECLSDRYVNTRQKMLWRCAEGHEWEAKASNVRYNGIWCPACAKARTRTGRPGRPLLTIDDMRKVAAERGGECLSDSYVSILQKMRWRCAEGHEWEAKANQVRCNGTWCPKCAGNTKLSLAAMQEIAAERGGECLSDSYVNIMQKMRWRCAEGHEWEARANAIKRGAWCRKCANHVKLSIDDMRKVAAERGGECLSDSYVNVREALRWRCSAGHEWKAPFNQVKYGGKWCSTCAALHRSRSKRIRIATAAEAGF